MDAPKRFAYVLKSDRQPHRYYTGLTADIHPRLRAHNDGRCAHTSSGRPRRVDVVVSFADEPRAVAFERYLIWLGRRVRQATPAQLLTPDRPGCARSSGTR